MAGPLQHQKWQAWYSSGHLPWDARRPSSQLVSYLTNCRVAWEQFRLPFENPPTSPPGPAALPPVWLPPDFTTCSSPFVFHTCLRCSDTKSPLGSTILEIGCGTGSSSIYLAQLGYKVRDAEAGTISLHSWLSCNFPDAMTVRVHVGLAASPPFQPDCPDVSAG